MHESLLGINVEHAVSLVSKLNNLVGVVGELLEDLEVRLGNTDSNTDSDPLHEFLIDRALFIIQLEKMGIGIQLKSGDRISLVVLKLE